MGMKLADYLTREDITAGEFSRRTGLPRLQCYRWAGGQAEPSIEQALAIVEHTAGDVSMVDLIKPKVTADPAPSQASPAAATAPDAA